MSVCTKWLTPPAPSPQVLPTPFDGYPEEFLGFFTEHPLKRFERASLLRLAIRRLALPDTTMSLDEGLIELAGLLRASDQSQGVWSRLRIMEKSRALGLCLMARPIQGWSSMALLADPAQLLTMHPELAYLRPESHKLLCINGPASGIGPSRDGLGC